MLDDLLMKYLKYRRARNLGWVCDTVMYRTLSPHAEPEAIDRTLTQLIAAGRVVTDGDRFRYVG